MRMAMKPDLEKYEEDFLIANTEIIRLLDNLDRDELEAGAALGGVLTGALYHLIMNAPDSSTAIAMLSTCLQNAMTQAQSEEHVDMESTSVH